MWASLTWRLLRFFLTGNSAPSFVFGPNVTSVAGTSFGVTSQLDMPGLQHYVVVPSAVVGELLDGEELQAEHIRDVSLGQGDRYLARVAVACGVDVVPEALRDLTISVVGSAAPHNSGATGICSAAGEASSCLSCPDIQVYTPGRHIVHRHNLPYTTPAATHE